MNSRVKISRAITIKLCGSLLCVLSGLIFSIPIAAQDGVPDTIPPPSQAIPRSERVKLDEQIDVKARVRLSSDLMAAHLTAAEKHFRSGAFDEMFRELGPFHALVDDSLAYLRPRGGISTKTADALRKLEFQFREFLPRLESIRRELPFAYEEYVRNLIRHVRNSRAAALDRLFSDGVVSGTAPQ